MSKNNIKIILALLAILMLGATYMYVFKANMDDTKALDAEIATLQTRYDELKAKEVNREQYITETAQYRSDLEDELTKFPATLDQEITVMFIKGINKDEGEYQFDVQSTSLGEPALYYTLGTAVDTDGNETPGYECYQASFPISYKGSYEGIKDLVNYIMNYKYRMNISSISIAYNSGDDTYTGSINLNAYCVSGEGRTPDTINVDVKEGVDNVFIGGDGAAVNTSYSYDSDNGDAIKGSHNLEIILSNANSDSVDGIIVAAGGKDTYVTSAENKVERLNIKVYEEDGKNYVEYSIGDSSYVAEITTTDLTVYVESSARVDGDDKNGVRVTVDNSTSLPVFFKVDGDDTTSPRFELGSKTGVVKVY